MRFFIYLINNSTRLRCVKKTAKIEYNSQNKDYYDNSRQCSTDTIHIIFLSLLPLDITIFNSNKTIKIKINQTHFYFNVDIPNHSKYIQHMNQTILVHYHEIALKGKNRAWFINLLVSNVRQALSGMGKFRIEKQHDKIIVHYSQTTDSEGHKIVIERLSKIFGIAFFCSSLVVKTDLQLVKETALQIATETDFQTFRISTKRNWKQFPLISEQINREVATVILQNLPDKKVSLKQPNLNIQIELNPRQTFIYSQKIKGAGGLPIGSGGKMLALLSGGIDSPVAAYLLMKRGVVVDFIHFSSYPFVDKKSEDKIIDIARALTNYQPKPTLHLVRIGNLQKLIVTTCDPSYRILIYRALMLKISEQIALQNNHQALINGESLGQVASQTIENITATSYGIILPILRPLIGLDKEEIIELAKKIQTYDTSTQPHQDCCSMFLPDSPKTKARPENLQKELNKLDLKNILQQVEIIRKTIS